MKPVTSLSALAELAGTSKATVSLALRNHPKISKLTRTRIQELARTYGYRVNPMVSAQMAHVKRNSRTQCNATIAFISSLSYEKSQKSTTPIRFFYDGVQTRARQLGFTLDTFVLNENEISPPRLAEVISARGIRGIAFSPLSESFPLEEFEFDWNQFALVTIDHTFLRPRLNSVCNDELESIERMFGRLRRRGYRRIGIALREHEDRHVKHGWLAGFQAHNSLVNPENRIPHLITSNWSKEVFFDWYHSFEPDAIICIDDCVVNWLENAGISVPGDVGCATLYWLPSRPSLTGFYQNHETMASVAIDLLATQLYHNDSGIPEIPNRVLVSSDWREGSTLRPE
jgi:LacI family transcriptional regulator